jgi:hypothetical protein
MKKIVRLTESDLVRIVKRVINEQSDNSLLSVDSSGEPIVTKLAKENKMSGTWFKSPSSDGFSIKPSNDSKSYFIDGPSSDLNSLPKKGSFKITMNNKEGQSFDGYTLKLYP